MSVASKLFWMGSGKPKKSRIPMVLGGSAVGMAGAVGLVVLANQTSPLVGMFGIIAILVTVGTLFSPTFGFLMVSFAIPLERVGRFTDDFDAVTISLSRIFGIVALGAFLLHAALKRWKLRFGTAFLLYAGYTAIAILSITYAHAPDDAVRDSFRILGNLMFFFLVINVVRDFKLARMGVIVWLLVSIGTGVYSIYDFHLGNRVRVEEAELGLTSNRFQAVVIDDSETRALGARVARTSGTTSHPGVFGLNLAMTLPFFAYLIGTEDPRWKVSWFLGFLIVCYTILLTNTRAVILLAIGTLAWSLLRGMWALTPRALLALVLVGTAILPFIPEDVYMRTLDPSLYSPEKSDSIRIRFKYWEKSMDILEGAWLWGIGVGNQTTIVEMITDESAGRITPSGLKASAHNEYIWTMVEVGILGWLLHWGFVGLVTWYSLKAASIFRRFLETEKHYWFMAACQIALVQVLLFALQTEAFHFALKGWWLVAALSCVMLQLAEQYARNQGNRLAAAEANPIGGWRA